MFHIAPTVVSTTQLVPESTPHRTKLSAPMLVSGSIYPFNVDNAHDISIVDIPPYQTLGQSCDPQYTYPAGIPSYQTLGRRCDALDGALYAREPVFTEVQSYAPYVEPGNYTSPARKPANGSYSAYLGHGHAKQSANQLSDLNSTLLNPWVQLLEAGPRSYPIASVKGTESYGMCSELSMGPDSLNQWDTMLDAISPAMSVTDSVFLSSPTSYPVASVPGTASNGMGSEFSMGPDSLNQWDTLLDPFSPAMSVTDSVFVPSLTTYPVASVPGTASYGMGSEFSMGQDSLNQWDTLLDPFSPAMSVTDSVFVPSLTTYPVASVPGTASYGMSSEFSMGPDSLNQWDTLLDALSPAIAVTDFISASSLGIVGGNADVVHELRRNEVVNKAFTDMFQPVSSAIMSGEDAGKDTQHRQWICSQCHQSVRKADRVSHHLGHLNLKEWTCTCGSAFSMRCTGQRHIKECTPCSTCHKKIGRNGNGTLCKKCFLEDKGVGNA